MWAVGPASRQSLSMPQQPEGQGQGSPLQSKLFIRRSSPDSRNQPRVGASLFLKEFSALVLISCFTSLHGYDVDGQAQVRSHKNCFYKVLATPSLLSVAFPLPQMPCA